jgi:hypothetical protein
MQDINLLNSIIMKKIIFKTLFFFGFLFFLGACQEKELIALNPDANTVVSLSPSTLVLLEENMSANATTISWTEPDFGFEAAAIYTIQLDFANGTFATPQTIVVGSQLYKTLTVQELNGKLLSLGVDPNVATQIKVRVETKLSNYRIIYSAPVVMTVTAYSTLLDLSTHWGVVGSATPGGWGSSSTTPIQDIPFYTTSATGVYVAYATVRSGEIKFRLDNAWTVNYGGTGMSGSLVLNGSNITITAGTYKFTVDTNNMTYTIVPFSWGIVGSGTLNGWAAPDAKLFYNSYADDWRTVVTLLDGEIKFRFNENWDVNYGGSNGILALGGGNIPVTAGQYLVIFNPITLEYSLETMDVWGLVGDGTPTGWGTLPDIKFIPDFGINEGVYYINGITLTSGGSVKVRQNDAWVINYGDTGNNGTLELNGDNIPVPATGLYNVKIDMNDPKKINLYPFQ